VIYCPKCGKATRVLATRADLDIARRRRVCTEGHQVHTEERVVMPQRSVVQLMSDRDQSESRKGIPRARA
jgi:transcriptional regulator NrdR family protein